MKRLYKTSLGIYLAKHSNHILSGQQYLLLMKQGTIKSQNLRIRQESL